MVAAQRVAALNAAQVLCCDACLDSEYGISLLHCLLLAETMQLEHVDNIVVELRTDVQCVVIVVAVVLLLGERETALVYTQLVDVAVHDVCSYTGTEETADAYTVVPCHERDYLALLLYCRNLIHEWLDCRCALGVAACAVHYHIVEVAYLLGVASRLALLRSLLKNKLLELLAALLAQRVELAVACVLIGHWVGLLPSAGGILEKVGPRVLGGVQV